MFAKVAKRTFTSEYEDLSCSNLCVIRTRTFLKPSVQTDSTRIYLNTQREMSFLRLTVIMLLTLGIKPNKGVPIKRKPSHLNNECSSPEIPANSKIHQLQDSAMYFLPSGPVTMQLESPAVESRAREFDRFCWM